MIVFRFTVSEPIALLLLELVVFEDRLRLKVVSSMHIENTMLLVVVFVSLSNNAEVAVSIFIR